MNHVAAIQIGNTNADIACPSCGVRVTKVVDSRGVAKADQVNRRRHCFSCGTRFSTRETVTPEYTGEMDMGAVAEKIARAEKSVKWLGSLLSELKRELGQ
jgi:predicted RNA-binding Zn-ribbon protein involved in translation (DUF1610 family)